MKPFEWVCLCSEHFIILYDKECPFLRPFFTGLTIGRVDGKREELLDYLHDCKGNKVYIAFKVDYSIGFRSLSNLGIALWASGKYMQVHMEMSFRRSSLSYTVSYPKRSL